MKQQTKDKIKKVAAEGKKKAQKYLEDHPEIKVKGKKVADKLKKDATDYAKKKAKEKAKELGEKAKKKIGEKMTKYLEELLK